MTSIFVRASGAATAKGINNARKAIPANARKHLPLGRALIMGGASAAANAAFDNLLLSKGVAGASSTYPEHSPAFYGTSQLLGGLTLKEARQIFQQTITYDYAKKNLFFIHITNIDGSIVPFDMRFFATELSYPNATVAGESMRVGSGTFDIVHGSEAREFQLTTLDDRYGSIKRWARDRHDRMNHPDGSGGLPIDYLFSIDITHAYPASFLTEGEEAYTESYVARIGSVNSELSKRDDNLEELQLTFVQFDTFSNL